MQALPPQVEFDLTRQLTGAESGCYDSRLSEAALDEVGADSVHGQMLDHHEVDGKPVEKRAGG